MEDKVTHEAIQVEIKQLKESVDKLEKNQQELLTQFNRYKGFFGGVTFVISAVWAAFMLFFDWIKQNGS